MIVLLLSLSLPIILIYYLLHKNNHQSSSKQKNLPPHPPGLPLIGNLHQLAKAPVPHIFLSHLSKIHGPLFQLTLGSVPIIVVSSAKLAKEVLKTQDSVFCSRPKLVAQRKLSYDGADMAFAPYGSHWKEMRRIAAAHLLSPSKVQSFRGVREEEVGRMVGAIARSAAASGSPAAAVDVSAAAMGLTTTLICRIGFGRRYEEQGTELRRFEGLLKELRQLSSAFFVADYLPALSWVDKVSGLNKRLDSAFEKLDSFYHELIDEHLRRQGTTAEEEEEDILGVQIKLEMKSSEPNWDRVKALLMVNIFFFIHLHIFFKQIKILFLIE